MNTIRNEGTTELTALIFIPKRDRYRLRARLRVSRCLPSPKLVALDFVHIATWNLVEQSGRDWDGHLLFISNFSGDLTEYLSNFGDILTGAIRGCFGYGQGFPGATPSAPFVDYVTDHTAVAKVYYTAYGESSTRDIGAAFKVLQAVTALKARALTDLPDVFAAAYDTQLDQLQTRVATPITGPERLKLIYRAHRHPSQMESLTVLFSVKPGCQAALCGALDAMAAEVAVRSPTIFNIVPGTHFARFVPLALPNSGDPGSAPKYLVFSAQIDGTCPNYVERLRLAIDMNAIEGRGMESVLACCVGYPNTDPTLFHEWFEFYTAPARLIIAEQPQADRPMMLSALSTARQFQKFADTYQGCPSPRLLAEFQKEFVRP